MLYVRLSGVVAAAALIIAPAAACAADQERARDVLTVYSGRSEQLVGPLFTQFTDETGIRVEARYGDSAELAAQLTEEGSGSPAQVFFAQDAGALGAVDQAGLFAPLPEAVAEAVPAAYRAPEGTWTGVTGRVRVIAYNTEKVSAADVPRSVFDLTKPRWKGQVAIAPTNASFQAFVTAMRIADGDEATRGWLEGLVANDVRRYEKEAEIGEGNMRARIAFTEPGDPGSLVNVAGAGILTSAADDPDAARFVEWLLSPATQKWFVANTFEYALIPSVPPAAGLPPLDSLRGPDVAIADLAGLPATLAMLEDVGL